MLTGEAIASVDVGPSFAGVDLPMVFFALGLPSSVTASPLHTWRGTPSLLKAKPPPLLCLCFPLACYLASEILTIGKNEG
jgi:hypothetical protein